MNIRAYLQKIRSSATSNPPRVSWEEIFWSWVGGFLGITAVIWVNQLFFNGSDLTLVFAPLGASAVLAYGAVRSPLAQPRNLVGGHIMSAISGVACYKLFHSLPPGIAEAAAVATAIALMHTTRTLHPPGGATALTAVIGSPAIHKIGWLYVLVPATLGPLILLIVAVLINNLPATRRYPEVWF